MLTKPEELNINQRPYKIYWHGKFLRSYEDLETFSNSLRFFKSFLIFITFDVIYI